MTTVAELLIQALADHGADPGWGVVGDALNPVTDAIRREERIEWVGVRHEEAGAFAASAQAQLGDGLAVCMGTVGPGAIHLLNGLYDAKKSHAPVLAICGQVPREEMGSDFFQEVDNDALFADVSVFNQTVTSVDQLPGLIEQAGNAALQLRGVAVLTLPGDVGGLELPQAHPGAVVRHRPPGGHPDRGPAARGGHGDQRGRPRHAAGRSGRPARPTRSCSPWLLQAPRSTLKAKEVEEGNSSRWPVRADRQLLPPRSCVPTVATCCSWSTTSCTRTSSSRTVVQLDVRGSHIGRRTPVDHPLVGDSRLGLEALLLMLEPKDDKALREGTQVLQGVAPEPAALRDPLRPQAGQIAPPQALDNPDARVRPELLAAMVDRPPRTTRSSPPTPACPRSGCPGSSG